MVLPSRLSLAPRTFMKSMDAALSPLRQMGICVVNYLTDWLMLRVRDNFAKSMLLPSQQIPFLGAVFDSTQMRTVVVLEVILKPRHSYTPKVLSSPFREWVITLSALPSS